tara:strand:- start:6168 stop:6413 length:246 start_codon:yes stop_codon:yes gene_type:complete
MRTINFLQYNRKPDKIIHPYFTTTSELTGSLDNQPEYEVKAIIRDVAYTMMALNELKRLFDFEVYSIIEDGEVISTEEDEN